MYGIYDTYSRVLVDNHITEEDPSFMRKFEPAVYAGMMKMANVEASMVYACCHNGNCYYPTKVGHMHKNIEGRDIFGETIAELRKREILPVAYYTAIYHNEAALSHPEWQQTNAIGEHRGGRFWFCCPNNLEYRKFTKAQLAEVVAYEVGALFIDMSFWPVVCYCPACQKRYAEEVGGELPTVHDWNDPVWVAFQRKREEWMAEYSVDLTEFVKSVNSDITVVHQFSPVIHGWHFGQSPESMDASDYASGDFYGGKKQHRIGTKIFSAFTRNMPYEFMTSRCVNLHDHTSMKSEEEMICATATTYANGGSSFFIDAINPDGTLNPRVYERLGRVNKKLEPYRNILRELKPVLCADVGLYFSMSSVVQSENNGIEMKKIIDPQSNMNPMCDFIAIKELLGASNVLTMANIPYDIVTEDRVDLSQYKTIVVPGAAYMSDEEVERLRSFVAEGGTLIATGDTSLYSRQGESNGEFRLADVFGVSNSGKRSKRMNYLVRDGKDMVMGDFPAPFVNATTAKVLGKATEPQFPINDSDHYASVHSNPPGPVLDYAGLTINEFGKGRCVYLFSSLLAVDYDAQRDFGAELFGKYAASGLVLESNAPSCVETTIMKSTRKDAYLISFINYQDELPNIPIRHLEVTVQLPDGFAPKQIRHVEDGQAADFAVDGNKVTFKIPELGTLEMYELS